jgi:hypothetical protein
MAIDGSSMRAATKPKKIGFIFGPSNLIGTFSCVRFNGVTMLLTAKHVYDEAKELEHIKFVNEDMTLFVSKVVKDLKVVYQASCLDQIGLEVPNGLPSQLGLKTYNTTYPRSELVTVCTPDEGNKRLLTAVGQLRSKGSLGLRYNASTQPGSSGSPLFQNDKVVGVHIGADMKGRVNTGNALPLFIGVSKESPVNYSICNLATEADPGAVRSSIFFAGETHDIVENLDDSIVPKWADYMDEVDPLPRGKTPKVYLENFPCPPVKEASQVGSSPASASDTAISELQSQMKEVLALLGALSAHAPQSPPPPSNSQQPSKTRGKARK